MRIKEGVKYYNQNKKEGSEKMTQKRLGTIIMPKVDESTVINYMSQWAHGKALKYLKSYHVSRICKTLKVDANFLFRDTDIKDYDFSRLEAGNIFAIMDDTKKNFNTAFRIKPMKQ